MIESKSEFVKVHIEDRVLQVTLDRPKANAIDAPVSRAIGEIMLAFRDDPELRVAIITGGGDKFFCAGWDLKTAVDEIIEDPDYGVGGGRETGMDARGILAEIDSEGDLFTDLFGEAPLTPEVAAAIADPNKIVVRTVSATARDGEKVAEEIELVAERAPGRLSRLWHWTLGWPARPHDPRYVLPRLVRRLAVVGGLPLLLALGLGLSARGSLYPESGSGSFGLLWTSGFGVVQAATIPTVTIDGIAVEPGAAAEAARLTVALWPALIAAGTDDLAPLREIATETFVAGYPAWLTANGLAGGAFVAVDAQLASGRGLLMSVDLPEAPTRLTVAAPGGIASVVTPTASGPFYLGSLRLTVVRGTDGGYRIDQVELLR